MKRLRRLATTAGIGVIPVMLLAVACGSSGPDQSAASAETGMAAYLSCLSSHGVTLPSNTARPSSSGSPRASFSPGARPSGAGGAAGGGAGGGGGGGFGGGGFGGGGGLLGTQAPSGVDQSTWDAAVQACASVRPTAEASGNRGGGNVSATRAYRNCLTEHGATATGPLATDDPAVTAAMAACAPLRPTTASSPTAAPG